MKDRRVWAILLILCAIAIGGIILAVGVLRNRPQETALSAVPDTSEQEHTTDTYAQWQLVSGPTEEEIPTETSVAQEEGTITVEETRRRNAQTLLENMTLEEKVAQLFFVTPEAVTGYEQVTRCGDVMRDALTRYPVGGLVFLAKNLETPEQTREMLTGMQEHATDTQGVPVFLGLDEEGGRVMRIGSNAAFQVAATPSMLTLAAEGEEAVYLAADAIGTYLKDLGFNLDLAPVADILTNPANEVIGDRSFGADPEEVARLSAQYAKALAEHDILAVYKHFPGHGDTYEDSHDGYAYSYKTLDELREAELIPFIDGASKEVPMIMVAHITLPEVTTEAVPATLSGEIVTDLLREEIGYGGIIITDALDMGAISNHYTPGEACVLALEAGCDMLLMADHFTEAYEAVLFAIADGRINVTRIDESVLRILNLKLRMK